MNMRRIWLLASLLVCCPVVESFGAEVPRLEDARILRIVPAAGTDTSQEVGSSPVSLDSAPVLAMCIRLRDSNWAVDSIDVLAFNSADLRSRRSRGEIWRLIVAIMIGRGGIWIPGPEEDPTSPQRLTFRPFLPVTEGWYAAQVPERDPLRTHRVLVVTRLRLVDLRTGKARSVQAYWTGRLPGAEEAPVRWEELPNYLPVGHGPGSAQEARSPA